MMPETNKNAVPAVGTGKEKTKYLGELNSYIKMFMPSSSYSILLNSDAKIIYISESLTTLTGISDASLFSGLTLIDAIKLFGDEEFIRKASNRLSHIMSGGNEYIEDDTVDWPNGDKRIYRISYKRITDEDSGFTGIIVVANDITDLRQEEAEQRLRDMLNSTALPCLIWDENGAVVGYNKEAARAFGVSDSLPISAFNVFFFAIQPEFQPDGTATETIRQQGIEDAKKNGFTQVTVQLSRFDGTPMYFMVTAACVSWMFGYRLIIYYYDITNEVLKENEAKEAEERIKLMFNSNPMICIMRDNKGNIIDCNQEALEIFGVSDKSDFCRDFYSYVPEYQSDGTKSSDKIEAVFTVLEENDHINLERTFRTPAGELIPVESKIVRMPWKNTHYFLSYSRDLREAKANEKKMAEIAKREHEARLQKEAAQAANEAKDRFLANISHEIRTPMNAILGMSELLLQENLSKRQLRYVLDIKTSATTLLDIINDILDVSKIQVGKLNLVPVHYYFNDLVDNASSVAQFLVADKDISFRLNIQEQAPICLYGDDVRLKQVLLNLISNAIKFTPNGRVQLSIGFSETTIRFIVSDTGMGIPEESLPTIFDAFAQTDMAKNRYIQGTGLGLTITKSIVEMMGGNISVESVYGRGSSFIVEIPKVMGDEALIYRAENKDIPLSAPYAKVLVVDDNIINLNVASGLLQLCQIMADTALSGKQAIEMVKKKQYDIIFMDHMMPGMDGIEATKIIHDLGFKIPIIALTASAVRGSKEIMLAGGMDDYLAKPIIRAELRQMLKKWIPPEKILTPAPETTAYGEAGEEAHNEFWLRIERIKGISLTTGLKRGDGRWALYRKSLHLMISEIEKCDRSLMGYLKADDMDNFRIEVHSLKSSLSSIGAMELSAKARKLETAADKNEVKFCFANLPELLDDIRELKLGLQEAFAVLSESGMPISLPPELPLIFRRLTNAFKETDLVRIDQEVENLGALHIFGAIQEEIEEIKDLVMVMDYEGALKHMHKLLDNGGG